MHKTIVTNAGSLRVGDVVLWDNETITEIINQSESSCDCWLRSPNERFMRRHVLSSANALIVVRGGSTLDAANAAGELEVQPSGLPIFKRPAVETGDIAIHTPTNTRVEVIGARDGNFVALPVDEIDEVTDADHFSAPAAEFVKADPAQLVTTAAPLSELYPQPPRIETEWFVIDLQLVKETNGNAPAFQKLNKFLNDGWKVAHEEFISAAIWAARLEREVRS